MEGIMEFEIPWHLMGDVPAETPSEDIESSEDIDDDASVDDDDEEDDDKSEDEEPEVKKD